jgi:hypothetical protein
MTHSTNPGANDGAAPQGHDHDGHAHATGCTAPTFLGAKIATGILLAAAVALWLILR